MRTCRGCGADYSDAETFCPDCGLGAGAASPDLATHVPESVQFEESTDIRSTRGTRTVVTSVVAVLVVITGTLIGIVLARDPNPTSTVDADHPPLPSVIEEPTSTDQETAPASNLNPDPHSSAPSSTSGTRPLVQVAPALAGRTGVDEVTALLHRYFTAINDKDRASWEA
ncbi:MAG TPA: hypothetical protein VHC49_04280, partial [Mycobacteriales bacterium]|nr:hypothetical protein [Mycobacteriales bacterium]